MRYSRRVSCSDDTLPIDEFDDLFDQLEQLEPPPSLIAHILSIIADLPLPKPVAGVPWHELDTLVVRHEQDPPC
jgi:hypothetical protein